MLIGKVTMSSDEEFLAQLERFVGAEEDSCRILGNIVWSTLTRHIGNPMTLVNVVAAYCYEVEPGTGCFVQIQGRFDCGTFMPYSGMPVKDYNAQQPIHKANELLAKIRGACKTLGLQVHDGHLECPNEVRY